ncbi:hypothetical protein JNUCC1_02275 [Lentibacillus sp. JNUCC-1]|uniref:SurA N-terminal domain-containing protein n=1 Tax=Lentibacillus sp. JNUCC-1 TaxID=2654513 RepID=UPI0012E8E187|nr:SurA N-terminal domain-containing protein [Lentibacillus sp. JNUCC-1]MUV38437.1 hypothetical protein [Lentibacillus sp. JNUCC-1]
MKKWIITLLVSVLLVVLAACGDDEANNDNASENNNETVTKEDPVEISEEEKMDPSETVVKINEEEIKGEAYNAIYAQVKTLYGANIKEKSQLKELTLDLLTQQELINQEAEELGIEVTEDEVEKELNAYKEQQPEKFQSTLERFQLSEAALKDQLRDDLIREKYIEDQFDINVTEDDVKTFYEQQFKENQEGDVPEFEEVRERLKEGLIKQEEQSKVQKRVKELKEQADIEVLIEA